MALAAIVLVAWLSQPPNNQVDQDASGQKEQPENSDISQPVTSMREYDPWADSYAQWMMAVLSVIATGVSVWAVLLLRNTLVETRRAIRAADDAVEVTREIGVIQMRPWLSFIQWTLEPIGQKGDVSSYIIVFKWRNTGSTPAISVRAVTNRSNAPEFVDEGSLFDYDSDPSGVVAPGLLFNTRFNISPEGLFASRAEPCSVRCVIRYDTQFSGLTNRITAVSFEICYIGLADLDAVCRGEIGPENILVRPMGSDDRMT